MNIDSIQNGIVIDHITAGKGMQIYEMLGFDKLNCPVAMVFHAHSERMGQKDIIKIDGKADVNLEVIGYVSPNSTVNIIKEGKLVEKRYISPPEKLVDIIKCCNPRCITTSERDIHHVFVLTDKAKKEYRCMYCESMPK